MFPNGLWTTLRTGGWNHTPLSLVAWSLSHSKSIWIYLDQQPPSIHSWINQDSCPEHPHVSLRIMHLLNFPAKAKQYIWIPVLFVVFSISGWELVAWWQQDDIRWNEGILRTCIIYLTDYATGDVMCPLDVPTVCNSQDFQILQCWSNALFVYVCFSYCQLLP